MLFTSLSFLQAFNERKKVVFFSADVSGAFDRVDTVRLVAKLEAKGVPGQIVRLFASWLRERRASVVLDGVQSDAACLRDMVYQDTVWGPML